MKIAPLLLSLALAACAPAQKEGWLGYVEGENALVAPAAPGWVMSLAVTRGQNVAVGDILFTLDDTREHAARDNAAAAVQAAVSGSAQTQSDVTRAQKELARQRDLLRIGGTPRRDLETAQAAFDSAKARLAQTMSQREQAEAGLASAEFNLSERVVRAKVAGRVEDTYFRPGEFANAGVPVVSILAPQNIYVRFFVPEEALNQLDQNARVHIGCDGCPPDLTATVRFIASQSEFTPPIIYSVRNRNRLVFKVEARFEGNPNMHMRPGLPVDVTPAPK